MNKTKGFTLIELLVVVVILGILAAFAFTNYRASMQTADYDAAVVVLNQIGAAYERMEQDNAGTRLGEGELGDDAIPVTCAYRSAAAGQPIAENLISCGYMDNKEWANYNYRFFLLNLGNSTKITDVPANCAVQRNGRTGYACMVARANAGRHLNGNVAARYYPREGVIEATGGGAY